MAQANNKTSKVVYKILSNNNVTSNSGTTKKESDAVVIIYPAMMLYAIWRLLKQLDFFDDVSNLKYNNNNSNDIYRVLQKNGTKSASPDFCNHMSQSHAVVNNMSIKKLLTRQRETSECSR